jgi:hypothetical protein
MPLSGRGRARVAHLPCTQSCDSAHPTLAKSLAFLVRSSARAPSLIQLIATYAHPVPTARYATDADGFLRASITRTRMKTSS